MVCIVSCSDHVKEPDRPNTKLLTKLFLEHRTNFENLHAMLLSDKSINLKIATTFADSDNVSEERYLQYRSQLDAIDRKMILINDGDNVVKYILDIGIKPSSYTEWVVGIEYTPENPQRMGNVVKDANEIDFDAEDIYLISLVDKWFIFYQNY